MEIIVSMFNKLCFLENKDKIILTKPRVNILTLLITIKIMFWVFLFVVGNYLIYIDVSERIKEGTLFGIVTVDQYIDKYCKSAFGVGIEFIIAESILVSFILGIAYKLSRRINDS